MGGEILMFGAAAVGACLFAFLVYRSFSNVARPYALPTLVFAIPGGIYAAWDTAPANYLWLFLAGFLVAAMVFGAQAHAIKWLRDRRT